MPLTRLEIEQTAQDRWVAEVEVGGISNYRITVRGNTFAQVMAECERAYYGRRPDERPYNPLPSDLMPRALEEEREMRRSKRVLSDEHKRAMAEGRARARAAKDIDEGPDAA
jgi:hypothetical protein